MKIRIAMRGMHMGEGNPETTDDVTFGVRMPWIELDGHKFTDGVIAATFECGKDDISTTTVTLEISGPVELVYTDSKGEPLPGRTLDVNIPGNLGRLDHQSYVPRNEVEVQ